MERCSGLAGLPSLPRLENEPHPPHTETKYSVKARSTSKIKDPSPQMMKNSSLDLKKYPPHARKKVRTYSGTSPLLPRPPRPPLGGTTPIATYTTTMTTPRPPFVQFGQSNCTPKLLCYHRVQQLRILTDHPTPNLFVPTSQTLFRFSIQFIC